MQGLIEVYRAIRTKLHPVELAAFHYKFILIHPFLDGNGGQHACSAVYLLQHDGPTGAILRAEELDATTSMRSVR